jgi:hypothetical protein
MRIVNLDDIDNLDDAVKTLQMLVDMNGDPHRWWRITPSPGGAWNYEKVPGRPDDSEACDCIGGGKTCWYRIRGDHSRCTADQHRGERPDQRQNRLIDDTIAEASARLHPVRHWCEGHSQFRDECDALHGGRMCAKCRCVYSAERPSQWACTCCEGRPELCRRLEVRDGGLVIARTGEPYKEAHSTPPWR